MIVSHEEINREIPKFLDLLDSVVVRYKVKVLLLNNDTLYIDTKVDYSGRGNWRDQGAYISKVNINAGQTLKSILASLYTSIKLQRSFFLFKERSNDS